MTRFRKVGVKKNFTFRSVPCNGIYRFRSGAFHHCTFLTRCKHVRQNGKLHYVSSLLNAKCESLNAMHRMRTVCDKWRDNLVGPEDQVLGKSSPTRQPQREKQEDAYYFCHVPQNIASQQLGI